MPPEPDALFDPARYAKVRRPLLEAEGLPAACYTDAEFFRRELDTVFRGGWLLAGRAERIPARGDYFTVDFAAASLVVIRDAEGRVRAYANACRHRGARLVTGEGNCRAFVCAYHSWTYALDGSLRGCPGMEETRDFSRADYGLDEIRCETWDGFIFYNLDGRAPPLAAWLGELPARLAPYRFADMAATRIRVHDLDCNWKTWVENYMEGYHIPTVHRATISAHKAVNTPEDPAGSGQYRAIFERHEGTLALLPGDSGFPPLEGLDDESTRGSRFMLVYPATMLALTIDAMWTFHVLPLGPERTRVIHTSLFPSSRLSRPDFEALAANYYKRQDRVVQEDNDITILQQQGLRSPLTRPGRFAAKEKIVHALDNWVLDRVLGTGTP
ncbi:MAG: aromatic ring-hydroxylating dioxygenase subunit alpha [Burkholderiales bacterium]|nr:aromatic ring-hydroxylating dioxygenase subunit alpha [Burkholderiales bacterium]